MSSDSKRDTRSGAWDQLRSCLSGLLNKVTISGLLNKVKNCVSFSGLNPGPYSWLNPVQYPGFFLAAMTTVVAIPSYLNYVQYNSIIENYRLNMTSINLQLYELNVKVKNWLGVEVSDFPSTLIFFPRAILENQENCQLDRSPGNGIGLLFAQRKQLDELVSLVAIIKEKREIVLHVRGFASRLYFSGLSAEKSNHCNLKAARLRGEEVGLYLESELGVLGVTVETETWDTFTEKARNYSEMDRNRPFPYEQESADASSRGIHALNQAVYITISSH